MKDLFDEMRAKFVAAMNGYPHTPETESIAISVMLDFARGLASRAPEPIRKHWAKVMREYADKLSSPPAGPSDQERG